MSENTPDIINTILQIVIVLLLAIIVFVNIKQIIRLIKTNIFEANPTKDPGEEIGKRLAILETLVRINISLSFSVGTWALSNMIYEWLL